MDLTFEDVLKRDRMLRVLRGNISFHMALVVTAILITDWLSNKNYDLVVTLAFLGLVFSSIILVNFISPSRKEEKEALTLIEAKYGPSPKETLQSIVSWFLGVIAILIRCAPENHPFKGIQISPQNYRAIYCTIVGCLFLSHYVESRLWEDLYAMSWFFLGMFFYLSNSPSLLKDLMIFGLGFLVSGFLLEIRWKEIKRDLYETEASEKISNPCHSFG